MKKSFKILSSLVTLSFLWLGTFFQFAYANEEKLYATESFINLKVGDSEYEEVDIDSDFNRGVNEDENDSDSNTLIKSSFMNWNSEDKDNFGGRIMNRLLILLGFRDENGTTTTLAALANVTSQLEIDKVTDSSAVLSWKGNQFSKVAVYYSTSSPIEVGSSTASIATSNKLFFRHDIKLKKLAENTTYYYRIVVTDHLGNSTTSKELSFTTKK